METLPVRDAVAPTSDHPAPLRARARQRGRRPYWWVEVLLILAFYAVYSAIRNASEGGEVEAFRHAKQLVGWERAVGLSFEETVQDWALNFRPLVIVMNYIYGSLHFIVTAGTIIYLFRRHPDEYPRWRNTLAATTAFALVGFILWPLMPPRLLPGEFPPEHTPDRYDYVDTLAEYPTFWSFDSGTMQEVSNQFAAMPSLHFGWSTFCALALVPRVRRRWVKGALASYPAVTLLAIVLTGNHYWLDAVGGVLVLGAGLLVGHRLTRGRSRTVVA